MAILKQDMILSVAGLRNVPRSLKCWATTCRSAERKGRVALAAKQAPACEGIRLLKGEMLLIPNERMPCVIRCLSGTLWITRSGDSRDYFLTDDGEFKVSRHDAPVVQAITVALVDILRR